MSFFDDLQARVNDFKDNAIVQDIGTYIQARVVDPVVKVGQPAIGNLSAAQIASGARGQTAPVGGPSGVPPKDSANANPNSPFLSMGQSFGGVGMLVILGGVAYFLLSKKSRS